MNGKLLRSILFVPANVPRFVQKASSCMADAIVLDLEDSVPFDQKIQTRKALEKSIADLSKSHASIMVRVNNTPDLLEDDVQTAVCERLDALFVPKVDSADQIVKLDYLTKEIEATKGLDVGRIRFSIHIESPLGLLRLENIVASCDRIESISLGMLSFFPNMGIELTKDASALLTPMSQVAITAKAYGVIPTGVLGSVAEFRDLKAFANSAFRAKELGFEGSICVHPDQVSILNRIFVPDSESLAKARRIIEAFEEAAQIGRASTTLDGRMVDTPIYRKALATLKKFDSVKKRGGF
ncbi:MAG: CoA ester lyase [Deltaproteobacteria bacterium]|nr:CoA ester lyase [Deltaproteobacteria bacterium]